MRKLKFDAVKLSHLVDAEYGNQGVDFKLIPREGFGWMNGEQSHLVLFSLCMNMPQASYQVGLSFLTTHMRRAIATCTSPEVFFRAATVMGESAAAVIAAETNDPLGMAMQALNIQ